MKKKDVNYRKKTQFFFFFIHQNDLFAHIRIEMPSVITGGLKMVKITSMQNNLSFPKLCDF